MDWKPYYDTELRAVATRDKMTEWLQRAQETITPQAYDSRTILSFPHTAVAYSGPLQAHVVSWLHGYGFKRVIALGVTHGSLIPAYRAAVDERLSAAEREAAHEQVSGAFLLTTEHIETPFGALSVASIDEAPESAVRFDRAHLLRNEFSLDTFCAVLRLAEEVYQVDPLPIIPLFIGMTRNPLTGAMDTAKVLGHWLHTQWDEKTAIVTTADVVHYGAFYGSQGGLFAQETLGSQFHGFLLDLLSMTFVLGDLEAAFQMARDVLKADHREILPLLSHVLGDGAETTVEAFALSDYSSILGVDPPCLVASALIAYKRRNARLRIEGE